MIGGIHQLILPNKDCRRLQHKLEQRPKQPGPGTYEYCVVCSLGYEMALTTLGSEADAERFVQDLRRDGR